MTGYLIHIDGALTRECDAVDPSVDKKLLARLEFVSRDSGRGRSNHRTDRELA